MSTNDHDFEKLLADPPPAVVLYAHKAFALFVDNSSMEEVRVPLTDDTIMAQVYRGKMGDIFTTIGASQAYYTKIRQLLLDSGSIAILERGTAHSSSVVVVRPDRPPPMRLPDDPIVKSRELLLTTVSRTDTLETRIEKLERERGDINIVEILRNFERRISRLEGNSQNLTATDSQNAGEIKDGTGA